MQFFRKIRELLPFGLIDEKPPESANLKDEVFHQSNAGFLFAYSEEIGTS